ncbi:hypothetical protein Leryth_022186 [Lithospermum erythrorhizon]|nr:hypothetical protein Leryth_022186 [Lithospermum erythrorhizon]
MERKVAIVGAGISGLLACKYTLSKGYIPIVFEAESSIGGVWSKTVSSTRLQTPKIIYQFSDFPWPDSVTSDFPTTQEVMDYFESYALHFDVMRHIKFSSKVLSLSYEGALEDEMQVWSLWGGTGEPFSNRGRWNLAVQNTQTLLIEDYQFDFIILCVGKYSGVPDMPAFPPGKGPEVFKGQVMHSMDYANMDNESAVALLKTKKITVVGLGKSAMDIAMECSDANGVENPCTLIYRKEHWNIPDYCPWGVPMVYLYLNRFAEILLHKPGEGFILTFLATILTPVRWAISTFVETHIIRKLKLWKYGMIPKHSFLQELSTCLIATVPEGFYDRVEEGSIKLLKAKKFSFYDEGIILGVGSSEPLKTDLVFLATGYRGIDKIKDIFVSQFFKNCIDKSDDSVVPMYRECISPWIPQLAIIGFSESVANLYTSEMRCRWVAELLDGNIKVPCIKDMEKDIAEWDKFFKRYSGEYYKKSCIAALHIWYNDQLCKDMGWNPRRKKGVLAELFEPYGPWDYGKP